ncbi:response regulator transcription factor [Acetatifactor muris]|uniref:response regulator transcription factor n=1 Tax=Acetatifactor muris TaxID=879566 RepID=UPI0023F15870|nr:helix-turn-helix domain-containing protein [Acetatifactor muris]MCI8800134.1 response regulator [Lachnospiraceae bacterium]
MYTLVIIDDEEKIVEGIAHLFPWEEIGFQVVQSFTNAALALDYIIKNPVDVVLSDIEMPGMNGLQLCEALQAIEGVHIIFFSSYQNYEYFRSAIRLSVDDYLLKPINYPELLTCFARVKSQLDEEHKQVEELSGGYYEQIVARTIQYLKEHYRQASLEEAAEQVNLSPAYLSKIFKEKSGTGFSDTLSSIRMNKAKEMLDDPQYKSYDIAYYLGYDNPKNFSRAFKAYFGMSPSEYRSRTTEE